MTTLPKDFYRTIQDIARKARHTSSVKQVFNDLIQVMFNSLDKSQRVHPYNMDFDPRLVRELREYKPQPELWGKLGELSLMWLKAIQDAPPFTDVMGSTYDEQLGEQLGQFLTPPDLADLMAHINLATSKDRIDETLAKGQPVFMGDDCGCGAGSLILAWLKAFSEQYEPYKLLSVGVEAQDLDMSMVQLTSVQVFCSAAIHGMPLGGLKVRWGNCLTEPDAPAGFTAVLSPEKLSPAYALQHGYQAQRAQIRAFEALNQ
tara:strand:- start:978 stop:1757 length:780 start_codon:yes stop_codon:yes gene_type:complete